jgi:CARDB protein
LEFLDEEQPYAPRRAPAPRRRAPEPQQLMARRLVAIVVGLLVLILLILGVKGCLNARKQRSLENFASDVTSLAHSTDQLSNDFFDELNNPGASGLGLTQSLDNIAGSAEGLLQRAEQLSTPGEMATAKSDLVLAYQLRRDGISGFSAALATGAGNGTKPSDAADTAVYHMKEILAGDVLYVHAKDEIDQVLSDQNVDVRNPPSSVFMQEPTRWLDPAQIEPLFASAGGSGVTGSPCPPKETCGLGITAASMGGIALSTSAPATVSGSSVDISVQNQGTIKETAVQVSVRAPGSASQTKTIPSIDAGATKTVTVSLKPAPASGKSVKIDVNVTPVPGEHVTTNNKASYDVTFG